MVFSDSNDTRFPQIHSISLRALAGKAPCQRKIFSGRMQPFNFKK